MDKRTAVPFSQLRVECLLEKLLNSPRLLGYFAINMCVAECHKENKIERTVAMWKTICFRRSGQLGTQSIGT
ncbi:TPA: hypothetical protein EYN65_17090 [Candidatus Poribacteria bacterium]|nr:hypothetical protein [Candidatus Poribacteria bacterium]HIB98910.1 hypothetical protein [Candidatus Poribacteria bacterium]